MQEHERWLSIAHEDLSAAKVLLKSDLFSSVTFHSQQAAEKSLKGYLACKQQKIIKTHDLMRLVDLCKKIDGDFKNMYDFAKQLNPFSTKFRYPTEFDIPDFSDAKMTIKHAQKIVRFVIKKISTSNKTDQADIFNVG